MGCRWDAASKRRAGPVWLTQANVRLTHTYARARHFCAQLIRAAASKDRGSLQAYQNLQSRLQGLDSDLKSLYRGKVVELRARMERVRDARATGDRSAFPSPRPAFFSPCPPPLRLSWRSKISATWARAWR